MTCHLQVFGKFHAQTDLDVKKYIMESFAKPQSHLCVLFTTVAFDLGVDATDLHIVIHYGPPHECVALSCTTNSTFKGTKDYT